MHCSTQASTDESDWREEVSWEEVAGKRCSRARGLLECQKSMAVLFVLAVVLEPLRHLTSWFLTVGHANIDYQRRPPLVSLVEPSKSPITKAQQYLGSLLDGKAARLELVYFSLGCNSLVDMKAKHPELSLFMRRILLTASSWIERRHGVIFGQWPWKLFRLCNPSMAQKDPRNNFYPQNQFRSIFSSLHAKVVLAVAKST